MIGSNKGANDNGNNEKSASPSAAPCGPFFQVVDHQAAEIMPAISAPKKPAPKLLPAGADGAGRQRAAMVSDKYLVWQAAKGTISVSRPDVKQLLQVGIGGGIRNYARHTT